VSQRRDVVSLYLAGSRVIVQDIEVLLAKADQALQTLQRYRSRLDEVLDRLTILEFDDLVTMGDVAEVIGRFEMVQRVSREVSHYITELGTEGRLVLMQAEELNATVDDKYALLVRDYAAEPGNRKVAARLLAMGNLTLDQLLEPAEIAQALGVAERVGAAEDHVRPRGFRVLSRIPMLPSTVINRLVERFETMPGLLRAGTDELDEVDGVGARRATAIAEGLARMSAHLLG
nr:DNA integrity scanning diadenylate cyclase DisA [Actinomycetota bacterium]